jgi:ADP-ribose pyrophosphatase
MEETVSSRVIYSGHVIKLRLDEMTLPSGQIIKREIIEHSGAVAIVALDEDNNVLLVKQYRHAAGKALLEIPAGGIEPSEAPEATVRREMQEETGYLPAKVERLGGFYSAPGYATEYLHVFLASGLVPARLFAEDTDEIELIKVPLSRIKGMIAAGEIEDAKSIAGLLMYLNQV